MNAATCSACGQDLSIGDWPFCPHGVPVKHRPAVHPRERTVVYQHPLTGAVRYAGRADVPIPARYAAQGYERREFVSARALEQFERQQGVLNESLHCNSGNTLDDKDALPIPTRLPANEFGPLGSDEVTINGTPLTLRSANA